MLKQSCRVSSYHNPLPYPRNTFPVGVFGSASTIV